MATSGDPFKGSGRGGGGSSGDPFGGSGGSSKPKPKKQRRWVGALLDNIEEFARGVGPGFAHLGKSVWNDTDRLLTGSSRFGSFMLDDVGGAIKDDYATRYGDLGDALGAVARGEFRKAGRELGNFRDQLATKPLDFILDFGTAATLGTGAVVTVPAKLTVSAAKASAKAGTAVNGAALLARSGSLKRAGYVERTPENLRRAELVYGPASKELRGTADIGIVRGVREVGTKAAAQGRIREPLLRPRKMNYALHKRDEIVERALGSNRILNKAPGVGLISRAAAQSRKRPVLERAVLERKVDEAQKRLQWLKQDELTAWAALHQADQDPAQFVRNQVSMLDESAARLDGIELDLNRARRAQLVRPEVVALVTKPTNRVRRAVAATKELADEVMQPIMENVVGMRREELLERRALPERVAAGAYTVKEHPEDLQPTKGATVAARELVRERDRRGTLREQVAGDLERMKADRVRVAERLRRVAQELIARARAQEVATRKLRDAKDQGEMRERAMTAEEAAQSAPERVRRVPRPGDEPSAADVELMIARMRNKLLRGRYAKSRGELRRWLAGTYNELRYGTPNPDAAAKKAEALAAARAKRTRKDRGVDKMPGRGDMLAAIDKFGPWTQKVANLADGAGPYRREYWKMVKDARGDDARFVQQWPQGTLARRMAEEGFHPEDRFANPSNETDVLADVIEEWLGEQVGEGSVYEIAQGAGADLKGAMVHDAEDALALIEEARHGDPDLPANPTDDEIADGIAAAHLPIEDSPVTQKEWVEQAMHAFLRVLETGAEEFADAGTELRRVRGRADLALAEKLGIGSRADGVEPSGAEWARAIEGKLAELGFDEGYREAAAALRSAQANFEELGTFAFRDDRFVPDPDQVDFGTTLEFVPELDEALRAKLAADAGSLTPKERATVRMAARKLEAAAARVERNGQAEAVLRRRLEHLTQPGRRERRIAERAEELQPMPLKGSAAPDGGKYRPAEFVNPETGRLFRDEGDAIDPGGSYLPHLLPRQRSGGSGARATGSVKNRPKVAGEYTRTSTGELFAAGTYENEAVALLDRARGLIRAKYASDLYDVAMRDMAMPFDEAMYAKLGGPAEWIVANPAERAGVAKQVESLAGMFEELKGLLPEEQVVETVRRLEQSSQRAMREAAEQGRMDDLVMIPRAYYERLVGDLKESHWLLKAVVDRPLDVFRTLVLFSRPAYYANNIAGQHFMLAVRDPGFVPTYIRFVAGRNLDTARKMFGMATDPRSTSQMWDAFFEKHGAALRGASAGQVETSGFGELTQRMALSGNRKQQIVAGVLRSPRTANELGAILSDDIPREVRAVRLMQPHVKAAREAGETGDDAEIAIRLLDADPVLAERIIDQTLFDLVDYRTMSPFEKRVIRRIVPFYGWMRGLTGWALELGYNHPAQFLLALQLPSLVGQDVNAEWNAVNPTWTQGAVRIGAERDGVQRIFNTDPINPVGTLGTVAMLARGAFSDDPTKSLAASSTFGQINPYAQTFLAAAFNQGKELGTPFPMLMPGQHLGQPREERTQWPGWIGTGIGGFIAGTPQATLYAQHRAQQYNLANSGQRVVSPTGVYQSPLRDYVLSYLGVPLRNVNLAAAAARRERDDALLAGEGVRF